MKVSGVNIPYSFLWIAGGLVAVAVVRGVGMNTAQAVRSVVAPSDASLGASLGLDDKMNAAISAIVAEVYGAFHDSWFDEDEDRAISALNGLKTVYQVQVSSAMYRAKYGKSLKSEVDKYMGPIDKARLTSIVKTNLS